MKTLRITTLLVAGLALLVSFALTGPAAMAESNPATAPYIDNQIHSAPGNSSLWYRFDYAPGDDHPAVTVKLVNGYNSGVRFEVYTPEQMKTWWDTPPIGQGTPDGDNLVWTGRFTLGGTYCVELVNDNSYAMDFQLTIAGQGVTLKTAAPSAAPALVPVTGAAAPASAANTDPGKAINLPVKDQGIPAKSSLWYRFNYAADDGTVTVTRPYGDLNHLKFEIYTPGQIGSWWDVDPVGRGSADGDDLVWSGDLRFGGTYYVRVVNDSPNGIGFEIK